MYWRSLTPSIFFLTMLLPRCLAQSAAVADAVPTLTVRGTVEQLDLRHNSFVLRVQTHTRIVYVTSDTDVSGLGPTAPNTLPVRSQERVTVGGFLQPNGTVLAGLLTPSIQRGYSPPSGVPDHILFGTVSSTNNKLRGRDIKVRDADGRETKIRVGRGIPIARADRPISVHDLSGHDEIRVVGTLDGTDLKATRIDVLPPVVSSTPATAPTAVQTTTVPDHTPVQPGL